MFKVIPKLKKIEAVREVLKGRPLVKVAKDYRVNRNSLHSWVKRAKKGMDEALIPEKRGPKLTVSSFRLKQEEIRKLHEECEKKRKQLKNLKSAIAECKNNRKEPRPTKCAICG